MAKDYWDKADIIAKILIAGLALIASVYVSFYGFDINSKIKERDDKHQEQLNKQQTRHKELDLSQKYIEIAVNILNNKPEKENTPLRDWAIDIIKKYTPIPLTPDIIRALKTRPLSTSINLPSIGASTGITPISPAVSSTDNHKNANVTLQPPN